jgi:hypothetical protein
VGAIFGRTTAWEVWGPSGETPELGTAAVIEGLRKVNIHTGVLHLHPRSLLRPSSILHDSCAAAVLMMGRQCAFCVCAGCCLLLFRGIAEHGAQHFATHAFPCVLFVRHAVACALFVQFLAWDTFARQRIDMVGRKDDGDKVIAHEFDASKPNNLVYNR